MENQQLIAQHYRIEREIGRGGMGTVYLATDTNTNATVAVKHLKSELAQPELIERFRREGEALRELNHPNIVKLLDAVEVENQHYLVMEYVAGSDLAELIKSSTIHLKDILRYALDLADALTRAHKLNIIHRDLKPANILIGEDGILRLTDFGIAQLGSKQRVTDTDAIVGTIDYLPPEAFAGNGIDTRADIWAFGVILFEMLTGQRPFSADNLMETIQQITTASIPDLEALNPDAPIDLIDLVYRMLERDPQARITSVRHIGATLEDILHGRSTKQSATRRFDTPLSDAILTVKHNLPTQTTPFVGRETEVDAVIQLLANSDNRLVTILASGGMGKTRLSLAVGEDLIDKYSDGVYFVELAPLSDVDNIITTIADTLGYHFQADGRNPLQQVIDFLSKKATLLILDNYEHLMDGVHLTTDLLKGAPDLNILATSRQRLNQTGETVYHLSGMEFPTWKTPVDALKYGSVQLFLQSAKRARPDFELDTDNLDGVARICKLVQGMPLGIVLAASWLSILKPDEIAEELAGGIDFLETEASDLPDRQHSIRAVFDYSWDHMTVQEQDVFIKLSVFRGGFTREAAQAVANANLRILMSLANKSLIRRNAESGRYNVHELLRQYAEGLLTNNLEQVAYDRHMAHFIKFLEQTVQDSSGSEAFDKLDREFDNIRISLHRCAELVKTELILKVIDQWSTYMDYRTWLRDALSVFEHMIQELVKVKDSEGVDRTIGRIYGHMGWFYMAVGEIRHGITVAHKGLTISRSVGEEVAINQNYMTLCACYLRTGDFDKMLEISIEYMIYFQDTDFYAASLMFNSLAHIYAGRLHKALEMGKQSASQKEGDWIPVLWLVLGPASELVGDYEAAKGYYQQALDIVESSDWSWAIALTHQLLGNVAVQRNNLIEAEKHCKQAFFVGLSRDVDVDFYTQILGIPAFLALRGDRKLAAQIISSLTEITFSETHVFLGEASLRPLMNQTLVKIKIEMDRDEFQKAWDSGKPLSFDEVKQKLYEYFTALEADT